MSTLGFRPLSGSYEIESIAWKYVSNGRERVSVPSRGLMKLNPNKAKREKEKKVSVPSRGLMKLNRYQEREEQNMKN